MIKGAGKTTLLNYLSGKMFPRDLTAKSKTVINGIDRDKIDFYRFTAFVQQEDILFESFTVKECLEFAAAMKCSADPERRIKKVRETIEDLELTDCENVRIGEFRKGAKVLQKGEKKRLSIAVELITNPSLIFLDEPTTGMDTFTAERIIQILIKMKQKEKTIIATIHQPNSIIYKSFDKLMILSHGCTTYFVILFCKNFP